MSMNDHSQTQEKSTTDFQTELGDGSQVDGSTCMVPEPEFTVESVYEFYTKQVGPAIVSSLPILLHRLGRDLRDVLRLSVQNFWSFVLPAWIKERRDATDQLAKNIGELWERALVAQQAATHNFSIAEFLVNNFDMNGDGDINPQEFLNLTEILNKLHQQVDATRSTSLTFWTWLWREWPMMDWKIGMFLWRTFGGILMVLFVLSIVPGRLHSLSGKILRWPILLLTYFMVAMELMVYIVIRLAIRIAEILIATPKHRALRRKMAEADSYDSWYKYAAALDKSQKRDKWQNSDTSNGNSHRYNWALIRQLMDDMRAARSKHDILLAEAVLQQCTRKNVGGIMSSDLFSYTNTGDPKHIVSEFVEEVATTIHWITDESLQQIATDSQQGRDDANAKRMYQRRLRQKYRSEKDRLWKTATNWWALDLGENGLSDEALASLGRDSQPKRQLSGDFTVASDASTLSGEGVLKELPQYHREQLIAFLKRARDAYGRTALCLSGGAMMGLYHFGHVRGLLETNCLPQIVSGTSAGSVVGGVLCTRTDEELRRDFRPEIFAPKMRCFARSWPDRIKSMWKYGHMFSSEEWLDMIQWFTCGQMTFEEAYKKTGRILCITLASTTKKAPPVLLNYITAPNILISSAIVASASVPGLVAPARLQIKDKNGVVRSAGIETYFDGSIDNDIPMSGLGEQFNCQFFVAAQVNPHIVPFFFNPKGGVGNPSRWSSGEQEASWRGGFLLAALEMYLKNDMKSKFRFLHDMEAAVGFTSTMMTQEFVGSTTIVPEPRIQDFFALMSDPTIERARHCFRKGAVASYQHAAMIRLHYRIADALEDCLAKLGAKTDSSDAPIGRVSRGANFDGKETRNGNLTERSRAHLRLSLPEVVDTAISEQLDDNTSDTSEATYDG